ncbi:hypothetical protein N321_02267, partial [Antrostomus carolinensis]
VTQVLLQFHYIFQFSFTAILSSHFVLASPAYISNKRKLGFIELLLRHHFMKVIDGEIDD